jgi:hypothetical protein
MRGAVSFAIEERECAFLTRLSPRLQNCNVLCLICWSTNMISQCSGGLFLLPPLDSALGERGHRCHFAWVPFSSVDAYPLGDCSFLLLLLSFATVLSSHCPDFPHASDLRLDLAWPWYYWSPLLCLHLFVGSIFFFLFSLSFLSLRFTHGIFKTGYRRLPFFPLTSSPDLVIGFTVPPFPPSPFPHRHQSLHRVVWL